MRDSWFDWKKFILGAVIALTVVISLVITAICFFSEMGDYEARSREVIKINALQRERAELYSQIELLEKERDRTETGGAVLFLCFGYADRNLYELIYPTVTYHEFRAVFTFAPGQVPTLEETAAGGLTLAQYRELLASDWEGAVKYSPDLDLAAMKAGFEAIDAPFPEIMIFGDGEYTSDMANYLHSMGINLCVCDDDSDDGMMKVDSEPVMYNPSVVKVRTNRSMNNGTPLAVTTGHVKRYVEDREVDCDLEKYEEMMRWLKIMQHQGGLRLQNTYDTDTVVEMLNYSIEQAEKSQREIARLTAEIEDINTQINDVTDKDNKE